MSQSLTQAPRGGSTKIQPEAFIKQRGDSARRDNTRQADLTAQRQAQKIICMPDNLERRGSPDNKRINVSEPWELISWAQHFRVSQERIRIAVLEVGTSAEAVREFLSKNP